MVDLAKIAKEYAAGKTIDVLGKKYRVHGVTIRRWLKKAGYKIRTKSEAMTGSLNPRWKGGQRVTKDGYVVVWVKKKTYKLRHRLAMEKKLGHSLRKHEVVHHRNEKPGSDHLRNLKLCTKHTHRREHVLKQWARRYEACLRCGTTKRKHAGGGLCTRCNQYFYTIRKRGYETERDENGKLVFSLEHRKKLRNAALKVWTKKLGTEKRVKPRRSRIEGTGKHK
jgi:hypothetical protein